LRRLVSASLNMLRRSVYRTAVYIYIYLSVYTGYSARFQRLRAADDVIAARGHWTSVLL